MQKNFNDKIEWSYLQRRIHAISRIQTEPVSCESGELTNIQEIQERFNVLSIDESEAARFHPQDYLDTDLYKEWMLRYVQLPAARIISSLKEREVHYQRKRGMLISVCLLLVAV